jgi:SAM-dependent methyltransferase
MSGSNRQTLNAYAARVQAYVDGTAPEVGGEVKLWIDRLLSGLAPSARMFELGSAFGRDADYIRGRGFVLQCSDAVPGFVALLRARGLEARLFNALTDPLDGPYELIFANAVLLHFTAQELDCVLVKLRAALAPGGVLAFSLKQGEGEEWSSAKLDAPRFFRYWRAQDLPARLAAAGFARWEIVEARTSRAHADWLFVTACVHSPQAGCVGAARR